MPPFGHAMRFVDCKERDPGLAEQTAKLMPRCPFRRCIEQVQLTPTKARQCFVPIVIG